MNSAIDVSNTMSYPLDSDLSSVQQYPLLEQLGPVTYILRVSSFYYLRICIV